jgi:hypothetical protein
LKKAGELAVGRPTLGERDEDARNHALVREAFPRLPERDRGIRAADSVRQASLLSDDALSQLFQSVSEIPI